ncbi:nipblb [Symbiodinium natans]|uniref:Nipblb protein n=1 Tax=Symbiodinium natans TaxID=878477 RepID=A0A812LNC5_9DINO|nr:nipblb [Symbiodinium natans]
MILIMFLLFLSASSSPPDILSPVDALYQVKVTQVAAGFSHAACVTDGGLLYLWGFGAYGQLGFGFDDLRSSARLGAGWSATKLGGGKAARDPGSAGFASTGQFQPWQQVWPRRCLRGPFRKRACVSVRCGAYHTIAQASTQALSKHALKESEVLCPLPLELSDLPAGFAPEEPADHILPPGAGLVECPRPVLRSTGGPRPSDIFRTLSSLFWDTKAPEQKPDSAPRGAPLPNCAKDGAWRRALQTAPTSTREMPEHPLLTAEHATTPKRASRLEPLPLPGPGGIADIDWPGSNMSAELAEEIAARDAEDVIEQADGGPGLRSGRTGT